MSFQNIINSIRKSWRWIWDSDSILSWIIALVLIFIFVKFIFFPSLSLVMGTSLPLAGVESSSMDHQIVRDDYGRLTLCGRTYSQQDIEKKNFDSYWDICGEWYENRNMTKQEFSKFSLNNGFRKGDIIIVWGRFTPKIGDIIIFKANPESTAPRPIIHRIVKIEGAENEKLMQTKGDHNSEQLTESNNLYETDETKIKQSQIIGKAIFKIPYLGYVKLWTTELLNKLLGR
ncbi:MAG: signal peptidase I [Nanoarchaeota archaeon]